MHFWETLRVIIKQGIINRRSLLSFLSRHGFWRWLDNALTYMLQFGFLLKLDFTLIDEKCCNWTFVKLQFQCNAVSWVVSEIPQPALSKVSKSNTFESWEYRKDMLFPEKINIISSTELVFSASIIISQWDFKTLLFV